MSNIKVLHVYKRSIKESIGGVENFIDLLCSKNRDLGVENSFLSISENKQEECIYMNGYDLHQAKQSLFIASTAFSYEAFSKFRSLAKKSDLIHYHYPDPFSDILEMSFDHGKPIVVTYHSDIVRQKYLEMIYEPLKRAFLSKADCIVATSPNYLKTSKELQKYNKKTEVISHGIDVSQYEKVNEKRVDYWRSIFGEEFFLFLGVARYYKGLHIALNAVKGIDCKLVIAGSGPITRELNSRIKNECIDNVTLVGEVSDIDKLALLHACKAFVFPSHLRSEAFGLSLLEAAAVGKALISCEIGTGTSYINEDRVTGIVIPPDNSQALRKAILELKSNKKECLRYGESARIRALEYFSIERVVKEYLEIYCRLVRKEAPSRESND